VPDPAAEPDIPRRRVPRLGPILESVAVLVAIALACGIVLVHQHTAARQRTRDQAAAAVLAAKQQVLELTTLDKAHIDAQLQDLRSHATGGFATQFEGILGTFASVVKKDNITATGKIAGAGLEKLSGGKATVIVASSTTVTNSSTAKPVPRNYRLRVTLTRVGARWLTSGMEFVA